MKVIKPGTTQAWAMEKIRIRIRKVVFDHVNSHKMRNVCHSEFLSCAENLVAFERL
jgi:hypothetical protein